MKLDEIISPRFGVKCYIIENHEDEFFVIYGSVHRKVVHGNFLYDEIKKFQENPEKWKRLEIRIKGDRDEDLRAKKDWNYINDGFVNTVVDVIALYKDGEKAERIS